MRLATAFPAASEQATQAAVQQIRPVLGLPRQYLSLSQQSGLATLKQTCAGFWRQQIFLPEGTGQSTQS